MASHTGAGRARSLGYTNVAVMPEGIKGWVKAGKTVKTRNSVRRLPLRQQLMQDGFAA